MAAAGDVFHNPITGERLTVLKGSDDTDGRYLAALLTVPPADRRCPVRVHPAAMQAVELRRGRVRLVTAAGERELVRGERVLLGAPACRDLINDGDEDAELVVEAWPAARFEALAATLMGLAREGLTDAAGTPDPLQLAVTAREFRDELCCSPPRRLQRPLFAVLAPLGRLRGRRATYPRHLEPVDRADVEDWPERPAPAAEAVAVTGAASAPAPPGRATAAA